MAQTVFAHGITVDRNEGGFYTALARRLAAQGVASLRFDFRGHGESGGRPEEMTVAGEVRDLKAAVNCLASRGSAPLSIVGLSFGAGVAVLYAGRTRRTLSSLVLLSPVLDYHRTFLEPETEWGCEWFTPEALSQAKETRTLDLDGFRVGRGLLRDFTVYNPARELRRVRMPVLLIHGDRDSMAPYAVAKECGARLRSGSFVTIRGADHGFEGYEERVFTKVTRWLLEHVAA